MKYAHAAAMALAVSVAAAFGQISDPPLPATMWSSCSLGYFNGSVGCPAETPVTLTMLRTSSAGWPAGDTFTWSFGDGTYVTSTPSVTHVFHTLGQKFLNVKESALGLAAYSSLYIAANPPSIVTATPTTVHLSENAGSFTLTLTRSGNTSVVSTVSYLITPNPTLIPSKIADFHGSLTFAVGETTKTLIVPVTNDSACTGNARQELYTSATDGTLAEAFSQIEIDEDDPPQVARIDDVHVFQTAGQPATATFTVTLDRPPGMTQYFSYASTDGTAINGVDYLLSPYGLTRVNAAIPPYAASATFTIPILSHDHTQPDKTFSVTVTPFFPDFINVARGTATCTITVVQDRYTLAPSPLELAPGQRSNLVLDVGQPFDTAMTLPIDASRDIVDVPASITIAAGAVTVLIPVTAKQPGVSQVVVHLPASRGDATARGVVTVTSVATLVADPTALTLSELEHGSIRLSVTPPRTSETVVALDTANSPLITVPASVTIHAGGFADVPVDARLHGVGRIVATTAGATPATIDVTVEPAQEPHVDHVFPSFVPPEGGSVTVAGTMLSPRCSFLFDGSPGADPREERRGISVVAPPHAPGRVDLTVVCGSQRTVVPGALTYGVVRRRASH